MKFIIDHEKIKEEVIGTIAPVIIKDPELLMPKRATKGSAGYDMIMPVSVNFRSAHISVKPHVYFDTYVKIEDMPSDMVGLVFLRSSVGITKGFVLDNAVAVIDSDYKDTIKISMHGVDTRSYNELKAGDRIAQIVFMKYHTVDDEIEPNQSRDGGIGSTGQ